MDQLIAPAINLGMLIALLAYYLRAPIRGAVSQRHTGLRDELNRVRQQLREAQTRYDEFASKLRSMDTEFAALRDQMRQDAQATKSNLLSEARRLSATIIADARSSAENLYSDLRQQLHADLGAAVLERAETLLRDRLTGDDRAKIRQDFSRQLESVQ